MMISDAEGLKVTKLKRSASYLSFEMRSQENVGQDFSYLVFLAAFSFPLLLYKYERRYIVLHVSRKA